MARRPARRSASSVSITLGTQGRIVIPAPVRRELGLKDGDRLTVTVEKGRLVLSRDDKLDERLHAKFAHLHGTGVAEERRHERRRSVAREARLARLKEVLERWSAEPGDPDEREQWERLKRELDLDRLSSRPLFS
jgi:AbrB family looped-hinge helix DNA binding protein